MKKVSDERGFGAVEVLLTIIAIALVVFVGFYVMNANKKTDSSSSDGSKTSTVQPTTNTAAVKPTQANLKAYLLKTCAPDNAANINAVFENQANQTAETDSFKLEGNYAIVNTDCTLADSTKLTTEFAKFSDEKWDLVVKQATSVSCDFLTNQGFPEALRAPYCQNGMFE